MDNKITGVEIDFIVKDSIEALEFYESVFDVERIEVTDFPRGSNEAIFTIFGTRFHLLDENIEYQLIAPNPEQPQSIWFNLAVEDISTTHNKAMENGAMEIQGVTELKDFGVSNSIFKDRFGYMWMLHEIHKVVSFEDRVEIFEEELKDK